jgi:hypothetical protein
MELTASRCCNGVERGNKQPYLIRQGVAMETEMRCLDLEYMELDEEERLTERDAVMLGLVREVSEETSYTDLRG